METPTVGLGTLGLTRPEESTRRALECGCTIVDTAEHYGNLAAVGAALKGHKACLIVKLSGLTAGEVSAVRQRLSAVLGLLGVAKADLCLMHWPGECTWDPTDMAPLGSPTAFTRSSWERFCELLPQAWANLSQMKSEGLCAEVGVSNFYAPHLQELAKLGGPQPFANQLFVDVTNQEQELVADMQKSGIRVLAYRPVAYRPFPAQVSKLAEREGASPQSVVLAWLLRRGIWPLVKSDSGEHCQENLSAPSKIKLSDEDLELLKDCEVGLRASPEWFAKLWKQHQAPEDAVSEEDVQTLVAMGIDEAKAREALQKAGGNVDAALDAALAED